MTEKEIIIQITRYINGDLNYREEDQLWVEFLKKPHYYHLFETELNLADLYQNKNFRLDQDDAVVREPVRLYKVWITAAAALLVAAALFLFSVRSGDSPSDFAMSAIDTTELLGGTVLRSEDPEHSPQTDRDINRAIALAFNGEEERAQQRFLQILEQPVPAIQEFRILYNLGILAYNDGSIDLAAEYFEAVHESYDTAEAEDEYLRENIRWYLANIYLLQGEKDQVLQLLNQLVKSESIHAEEANRVLANINS